MVNSAFKLCVKKIFVVVISRNYLELVFSFMVNSIFKLCVMFDVVFVLEASSKFLLSFCT
jgi:hypothetical protein